MSKFHAAAKEGNAKEVVRLLTKAKAKFNVAQDDGGGTALHYAAAGGHVSTMEALLKHGADINQKNSSGWTPLHNAAFKGQTEAALYLIEKGADPTLLNIDGVNASDQARAWGHVGTADAINSVVRVRSESAVPRPPSMPPPKKTEVDYED